MILLRRLFVFVAPLVCLVVFSLLVFRHAFGWWSVVCILLATVGTTWYVVRGRVQFRETFLFCIVPFTMVGSALHILFYVSDLRLAGTITLVVLLLFWWYEENLFLFLHQPQRYQTYALEHIAAYTTFVTNALFFSGLFAAHVFLNLALYYVLPIGVVYTLLMLMHSVWSMKVPKDRAHFIVAGQLLVTLELMGVVSFLPTTFFTAGLLLALPLYFMNNLTRHAERGTLERAVVQRYVLLGCVTLGITLVTAPWH